jgi:hypothetical protein
MLLINDGWSIPRGKTIESAKNYFRLSGSRSIEPIRIRKKRILRKKKG